MRFMMIYTPSTPVPPKPQTMAEIGRFSEEMKQSGVLVSTGGLLPQGGRLKLSNGNLTDGPFAEGKEVVIGWALVDVKTKEEAMEIARRFMRIAGDGDGEVRQVIGPDIK
jgi:hypothetical protein